MGKGGGMRWTPEQLAEFQKRRGQPATFDDLIIRNRSDEPLVASKEEMVLTMSGPAPTGKAKLQALGRLRDGSMNKTETRYAQHLDVLKHQGEILWWAFEGIKLRLADRTFYTPDFFVMRSDGSFEAHEVKGFMMDDANVKIKVANEAYPFRFIIVRQSRGSSAFDISEVGNGRKEGQ